MPATSNKETNSTLADAVKARKKPVAGSSTEELLQMILTEVTKLADYLTNEEENENVTTQESHTP